MTRHTRADVGLTLASCDKHAQDTTKKERKKKLKNYKIKETDRAILTLTARQSKRIFLLTLCLSHTLSLHFFFDTHTHTPQHTLTRDKHTTHATHSNEHSPRPTNKPVRQNSFLPPSPSPLPPHLAPESLLHRREANGMGGRAWLLIGFSSRA